MYFVIGFIAVFCVSAMNDINFFGIIIGILGLLLMGSQVGKYKTYKAK